MSRHGRLTPQNGKSNKKNHDQPWNLWVPSKSPILVWHSNIPEMVGNHISVVQPCGLHLKRAVVFCTNITPHSKEKPVGDTFHDEWYFSVTNRFYHPIVSHQRYCWWMVLHYKPVGTSVVSHPLSSLIRVRRQLLAAGAGTASFHTDMADRSKSFHIPSGYVKIAIENGHKNSWFSH